MPLNATGVTSSGFTCERADLLKEDILLSDRVPKGREKDSRCRITPYLEHFSYYLLPIH